MAAAARVLRGSARLAALEAVLAGCGTTAPCERAVVPADLRGQWGDELLGAGLDRAAPTAWLAEGLLTYLTVDEAARLLTGIGGLSAPGSRLAFEQGHIASSALLTQARGPPSMGEYTSLWKGGLGQDAPGWLSRQAGDQRVTIAPRSPPLTAVACPQRRAEASSRPSAPGADCCGPTRSLHRTRHHDSMPRKYIS
jgi:O-methyltransferase involved in polyketide biosynthesis